MQRYPLKEQLRSEETSHVTFARDINNEIIKSFLFILVAFSNFSKNSIFFLPSFIIFPKNFFFNRPFIYNSS